MKKLGVPTWVYNYVIPTVVMLGLSALLVYLVKRIYNADMREVMVALMPYAGNAHIIGTTARSGGVMWIPDNRFMKSEGIHDSPEQAIRPGSPRGRRRAPAAGWPGAAALWPVRRAARVAG